MGCSDRGLHFQLKIAPLPEMDEEAIFMLIDLIRSAQKDDEHAMLQLINRFDKLFQKYGRKLRYEDAKNDLIVDFIELIKTFDFEKIKHGSMTAGTEKLKSSPFFLDITNPQKRKTQSSYNQRNCICRYRGHKIINDIEAEKCSDSI